MLGLPKSVERIEDRKTYQCVSGSTDSERDEFDGPQPAHALPANGEESDIEEEESSHGVVRGFRFEPLHSAENDHANAHAASTEHCESASTKVLVNAHDGDDRCDEEPSSAASRE